MRVIFGSIPETQLLLNDLQASASRVADCKKQLIITGLKTLSSKCPFEPAKVMVVSFPIICAHTIVNASICEGFALPGIIDEPGSFAGRVSSPIPERGFFHNSKGVNNLNWH
jgi:hypothetical protein